MNSPVKFWRNQKGIRELLGQQGEVVTWTVIRVPPEGFSNQAPYITAVVKLTSGRTIICQVVDFAPEEMEFGLKVRTVIRKISEVESDGVIPYGIKVTPLTSSHL